MDAGRLAVWRGTTPSEPCLPYQATVAHLTPRNRASKLLTVSRGNEITKKRRLFQDLHECFSSDASVRSVIPRKSMVL